MIEWEYWQNALCCCGTNINTKYKHNIIKFKVAGFIKFWIYKKSLLYSTSIPAALTLFILEKSLIFVKKPRRAVGFFKIHFNLTVLNIIYFDFAHSLLSKAQQNAKISLAAIVGNNSTRYLEKNTSNILSCRGRITSINPSSTTRKLGKQNKPNRVAYVNLCHMKWTRSPESILYHTLR